jgi:hypothetical protein
MVAVCSQPGSRMDPSSRAGVDDGGVLEDNRWRRRCLGHRDNDRWKFLEIFLSVVESVRGLKF